MSFVVARRAMILAALSLAALAPASTGFAHGPSRQKVAETIEIAAPAEKVWAIVGNFQDLSWLPPVAKTEGAGGNEAGKATRHITLKNGGEIDELLTKYDAADFSLAYRIEKVDVKVLPVNNYSSTMTVKAQGDKSVVEWKGAFYRGFPNNDPPPELSDEAALAAIAGLYKSGLAALKEKVESGK